MSTKGKECGSKQGGLARKNRPIWARFLPTRGTNNQKATHHAKERDKNSKMKPKKSTPNLNLHDNSIARLLKGKTVFQTTSTCKSMMAETFGEPKHRRYTSKKQKQYNG